MYSYVKNQATFYKKTNKQTNKQTKNPKTLSQSAQF